MFKTNHLEKLVKYAVITGFLRRSTAPLSLMLIAPPESNKTSILKQFESVKNVKYTIDLSSKPLISFLKGASKDKFYHIIVPDFIKVVTHRYTTASSVITTLNSAIEEGIRTSMFYGQEIDLKKNVKIGLITSMTPDVYKAQFKAWNEIGWLTRFLTVSYKYSNETRLEIMKLICGDGEEPLDDTLSKIRKKGQKNITISRDISEGIMLFADNMIGRLREYFVITYRGDMRQKVYMDIQGFRLLKQLRLLAKAIAYDHGRDAVNYEDLAELKLLLEYVNMPDNPKEV